VFCTSPDLGGMGDRGEEEKTGKKRGECGEQIP
jgi:hypothetical protein